MMEAESVRNMFRNTLFHLHRQDGVKNEIGLRNAGVFIRGKVWLENSLSQKKAYNKYNS